MEKKVTSTLIKGLIIALILIVISIVAHFTGQREATWAKWVPSLILIAGLIYSRILYSDQMDNNVTFGNAFADGFKTGAVATCLLLVFTVVFIFLNPSIKEQAIATASAEMDKQGQSSEADKQKALQIVSNFFYVMVIAVLIIGNLIISVIGALIGAAVAKKNPNPTPFQQ